MTIRTVRDLNPTLTTVVRCKACGKDFQLVDALLVRSKMVCPYCHDDSESWEEVEPTTVNGRDIPRGMHA